MAVLGLHYWKGFFAASWDYSLVAVRGLLIGVASLVAGHRL